MIYSGRYTNAIREKRTLKGDRTLSHDKPNEEIRELAALFSLGALTQHEADSFEAHMREGCPVCEAEYDRFKHITAEIGLTVNETDTSSNYVEHPELVAQRIKRYVGIVGRERVIAGTDCGFGTFAGYGKLDGGIAYKKLQALVEGAAIASERLWA